MSGHTPGPWSLDDNDLRDEAQMVLADRTGCSIADVFLQGRGGECEANARLIAAAPELLDALIRVRDNNRKGVTGAAAREAWAAANAAIAKATGPDRGEAA